MTKLLNRLTTDRINYPRQEAHKRRATDIKAFILCAIAVIILLWASGCTPQHGCNSTKGMSGYGWIKCTETNKVTILGKDGSIVCSFVDASNLMHSRQ